MKKLGTITFHASYNYGSNLQAYALQEYIKKITKNRYEYNIINLRTIKQKETYKNMFKKKGVKNFIKKIFMFNKKNELEKKDELFEKFIKEYLNITKEYSSLEDLKQAKFNYDYYISGSDQLWNIQADDFDWANYLEFIDNGKKISYAASFGPKVQTWDKEIQDRIKNDLMKYNYLSVRENGSFNNVKSLTGIEAEINVDPTMLLTYDDWNKIISQDRIYNEKYILLYNLKKSKEIKKIAKKVSKLLKLPVLVTNFNINNIFSGFEEKYDVGPIEFLNLIKNAELVLSSSFHGTIFSILLEKPFFAINGIKDLRIQTLLQKMKLEDRSIEIDNIDEKCKVAYNLDFKKSKILLEEEREKSKKYLMKALEIED